ncbi:MAG: hypothetical protein IJL52_07295 [Clostridia bacterium]|nr:hypothetical protein [Clostridia bacterium]
MQKSKRKKIVVIILCAVLVVEIIATALIGRSKAKQPVRPVVEQQTAVKIMDNPYTPTADGLLLKIVGMIAGETPADEDFDIGATLRSILYTNNIVNTLMDIVYPMLYDSIKNDLAYAQSIHLFGTGPLYSSQLKQQPNGPSYMATDKDGERKPLIDILDSIGNDWNYMKTPVTWTTDSGEEVTTTIFQSIDWHVSDMASFCTAITDMSLGFRGLLELTLQGKVGVIATNLLGEVGGAIGMPKEKFDNLPIRLQVAEIKNMNEKTGYEHGIIYLYNLLGLVEGEYPTVEEFCAYPTVGEMFKSLIETIIYAVEKIMTNPLDNLCNVLLNLIMDIDSKELSTNLAKMNMESRFTPIAKMIGQTDGEMFNLGTTLLNVVNDMGIPVYGDFNELLAGALHKFLDPDMEVPQFDVEALKAKSGAVTLSSGYVVYHAKPGKTLGALVDYILQADLLEGILQKVSDSLIYIDEAGIKEIVAAFNKADADVTKLLKKVLIIALSNM